MYDRALQARRFGDNHVASAANARFWHPWIGLLLPPPYLDVQIWRRDIGCTEADRAWQRAIIHYIRNEDEDLPPIGRFNYGQKCFLADVSTG